MKFINASTNHLGFVWFNGWKGRGDFNGAEEKGGEGKEDILILIKYMFGWKWRERE